ncbi:MAG: fumarylacetoacetate hydrolase family protein [Ilumatobacteraceae bacterium]|nr:fumarylacetoacetate hydrolase family protein [Ilumatobacteraceae bacterium]
MKIARFDHEGTIGWGFVEDSLIAVVGDSAPPLIEALALDSTQLRSIADGTTQDLSLNDVTLLAPVPCPPQFVGIGLNYADHAAETGIEEPANPQTFCFLPNAITHPGSPIQMPSSSKDVDWEVELAIVIGKPGKRIRRQDALQHVAGYTIVNDVSARDIQFSDGQWTRGKSLDTFKPMGPWITTVDELGAAKDLSIMLKLNDEVKQSSNTSQLIFDVAYLVHFLSQDITLQTGSVISTGTPGGVGFSRQPPEFLKPGDVVHLEIEGIGTLANPVVR